MRLLPNFGLYWPDFESGAEDVQDHMLGRVNDIDKAVGYVRTKGVVVQAGGHVGLWPRQLAKHFTFVKTFEPCPSMFECLCLNVKAYQNVIPMMAVLGDVPNRVPFSERRSGRSKVDPQGLIMVEQITIDSLNLPRCDLLYLDIEGYEMMALAGAKVTIQKFRPVVVLETLRGHEEQTMRWADTNRYRLEERAHSDWIFTP